jgi:hypothetical protein
VLPIVPTPEKGKLNTALSREDLGRAMEKRETEEMFGAV